MVVGLQNVIAGRYFIVHDNFSKIIISFLDSFTENADQMAKF